VGARRSIFVPEHSERRGGSLLAGQRGPYSWGGEWTIMTVDDDADTSSRGKYHGGASACWRKRVEVSEYARQ
jgi:hypothetical protein